MLSSFTEGDRATMKLQKEALQGTRHLIRTEHLMIELSTTKSRGRGVADKVALRCIMNFDRGQNRRFRSLNQVTKLLRRCKQVRTIEIRATEGRNRGLASSAPRGVGDCLVEVLKALSPSTVQKLDLQMSCCSRISYEYITPSTFAEICREVGKLYLIEDLSFDFSTRLRQHHLLHFCDDCVEHLVALRKLKLGQIACPSALLLFGGILAKHAGDRMKTLGTLHLTLSKEVFSSADCVRDLGHLLHDITSLEEISMCNHPSSTFPSFTTPSFFRSLARTNRNGREAFRNPEYPSALVPYLLKSVGTLPKGFYPVDGHDLLSYLDLDNAEATQEGIEGLFLLLRDRPDMLASRPKPTAEEMLMEEIVEPSLDKHSPPQLLPPSEFLTLDDIIVDEISEVFSEELVEALSKVDGEAINNVKSSPPNRSRLLSSDGPIDPSEVRSSIFVENEEWHVRSRTRIARSSGCEHGNEHAWASNEQATPLSSKGVQSHSLTPPPAKKFSLPPSMVSLDDDIFNQNSISERPAKRPKLRIKIPQPVPPPLPLGQDSSI